MADTTDSSTVSHEVRAQLLLNVFLSEYQALTNRCTYWISLQCALLQIPFIYLAIIAAAWNSLDKRQSWAIWGSHVIFQLVGLLWFNLGREQYIAVRYMETELRPKMEAIAQSNALLGYERFLNTLRKKDFGQVLTEFGIPCVLGILIGVTLMIRWEQISNEAPGFIINVILLSLNLLLAVQLHRMRKRFFVPLPK